MDSIGQDEYKCGLYILFLFTMSTFNHHCSKIPRMRKLTDHSQSVQPQSLPLQSWERWPCTHIGLNQPGSQTLDIVGCCYWAPAENAKVNNINHNNKDVRSICTVYGLHWEVEDSCFKPQLLSKFGRWAGRRKCARGQNTFRVLPRYPWATYWTPKCSDKGPSNPPLDPAREAVVKKKIKK